MTKSGGWRVTLCALLLLVGLGAAHYATALTSARQRAVSKVVIPLPGTPDLGNLEGRLNAKGLTVGNPVFIRIFKEEAELELWMEDGNRFVLLDTYPICNSSGGLGPKLREGDRQNPEGFYSVTERNLHGGGRWPRSLNIGFPNGLDRSLKRTGSYILIHGGCSSTGCFAMTNPVMQEIYFLADSALKGGQNRIQIHVFPFRMSEANMRAHAESQWLEFWQNLRQGYDAFAATQMPPRIGMCDQRYVVETQRPGQNSGALSRCAEDAEAVELHPADAESPFDEAPPTVTTRTFRNSHAMKLRARRAKMAARARPSGRALATPRRSTQRVGATCNTGLPSCRKFLALKATARSRYASAGSSTRER
jgi:murein L,D-transpeptidase YafK